jgi:hypothetical protein
MSLELGARSRESDKVGMFQLLSALRSLLLALRSYADQRYLPESEMPDALQRGR